MNNESFAASSGVSPKREKDMKDNIKEKTKPKLTNGGLLVHFLKGSFGLFIVSIAASMLMTLITTVIPQVIKFTIDNVIGNEPVDGGITSIVAKALGGVERVREGIWIVALAIILLAVLTFITRYCSRYFMFKANETLLRKIRNDVFSHVQRLPLSWQLENNTGDIIQRCTSDADKISDFVCNQLFSLIRIALLLTLSLIFMFQTHVKLALIAMSFIPVIIGYSIIYYKRVGKKFKECDEQEGVLSTIAQENLTGVRVVRAFGRERYERDKFERQNTSYTGLWVRLLKKMAFFWISSDLVVAIQLLFIVVFGVVFCVNGEFTAGGFTAFISYNSMMIGPVRELGRIISNLSKANVALGRIGEVMNAEEEDYGENEGRIDGDIVFDNVCFEYLKDKPVLENVSFTIPQGSTLGIVGGTGSGKSTIAALIDGLYPVKSGSVSIGGKNIQDIPPATLRNNIGLVMQEGYVYSRTIGENIGIAAEDSSIENIKRAASVACVDDAIEGFANGYDTIVGERGVTLSGGQKQRVAIARTIIRDMPYVIFDDSLSAVDSDTDSKIRSHLKTECEGITTVIIAHRLTTVMHADNIIVLDGGKIVEQGNHKQLIENNGLYKRIFDLQMDLPDELKAEVQNG